MSTDPMSPAMAISWVLSAIRSEAANLRELDVPLREAVEEGAANAARALVATDRDEVARLVLRASQRLAYVAAGLRRSVAFEMPAESSSEATQDAEDLARSRAEQDRASQVIAALTDAPAMTDPQLRAAIPGLTGQELDRLERARIVELTAEGWALTPMAGTVTKKATAIATKVLTEFDNDGEKPSPFENIPAVDDTIAAAKAFAEPKRRATYRTAAEWVATGAAHGYGTTDEIARWALAMGDQKRARWQADRLIEWVQNDRHLRANAVEGPRQGGGERNDGEGRAEGQDGCEVHEDEADEQHAGAMPVEGATL